MTSKTDGLMCLVVDVPGETREQFEAVMAQLATSGPVPPAEARLLVSGEREGGWQTVSVWENEEAMTRFETDGSSNTPLASTLTFAITCDSGDCTGNFAVSGSPATTSNSSTSTTFSDKNGNANKTAVIRVHITTPGYSSVPDVLFTVTN
jgi:hypothetical protein